ncbi:MAG: phosphonate ABC transporter, permease protein PhnE [Firmicutes bacterium]|nr:phosphonate ABC transporter, permease protein PhnE [Bacillota bacterium]
MGEKSGVTLNPAIPWPKDPKSNLRWVLLGIFLLLVFGWSAEGTNLSISELVRGYPGLVDIVSRMFPPSLEAIPRLIDPSLETIQISIWGTTLAIIMAIPIGLTAARNISPHPAIYQFSRFILSAARSINEIVFALVFVAAVGLGPFPGVLALACHSVGMLGKFLADSIEHTDPGPLEALKATGANKWQVIAYAVIPQIMPEFVNLCLYRWEINFRSATTLGIVGAGGIGFELISSMRLFMYHDMTTIVLVIFLTVTAVDSISSYVRSRII